MVPGYISTLFSSPFGKSLQMQCRKRVQYKGGWGDSLPHRIDCPGDVSFLHPYSTVSPAESLDYIDCPWALKQAQRRGDDQEGISGPGKTLEHSDPVPGRI